MRVLSRRTLGKVLALFLCAALPAAVTSEARAQQTYRAIAVKDGGSIHGSVRLSGASGQPIRMPTGKDEKICGSGKLSPRLVVGDNGGVANTIVFLEDVREGKRWAEDPSPVLDQRACEYEPHVLIVPRGTDLAIVNSDQVLHNVHAYETGETERSLFNIAQPIKGQRTPVRSALLPSGGILHATCDAGHPWMSAYVVVADHPYYEVTDADGRFVMTDVPPGTYTLTMWHEGVAVVRTEQEKGAIKKYTFEPPYTTAQEVIVAPGRETAVGFDLVLR